MATPSVFVPASQVVATAKSVLEGADNMDRAFFKEWVYLGLQELGPNMAWFGEATIYPVDYALRKPADLHSTIGLALYDSEHKELQFVYRGKGSRIHESDNELVNDGTYAPGLGAPIDLSEDAYYYNLGTSEGAQRVAYAKIKYFRLPVDEEGDLMVPESDVFPLTLFLRYMWYMRKDDKRGMAMAHPIWIAARNEARTAHKIPDMLLFGEIARTFNSMIPKQRFKQF